MKKFQRRHCFEGSGHGNRLATSCKFMAPFCLGKGLDLGELITLCCLCDLQALEIQNQGFNYKTS